MLTIDRLAKIDSIAMHIITALYRGLEWVGDQYEARLVDAAYKVAEAKATAIGKAAAKISDLEDEQAEAAATYIELKDKLRADFLRLTESLDKAQAKAEADVQDKIAAAELALAAADKAYDQAVSEAYEKLGVELVVA